MNKYEALRDVVSTAAVGCLLPDLTNVSEGMNYNAVRRDNGNKDGQWELKKRFMNTRQICHKLWIKYQKSTLEEQKEHINPMYMRVNGDTKKLTQNELVEGNNTRTDIATANEPQEFPSLLKKVGSARSNQSATNVF